MSGRLKALLADEKWTRPMRPAARLCAAYPGAYDEASSSLGYHFALGLGGALGDIRAQRAFPPSIEPLMRPFSSSGNLRTIEEQRGLAVLGAILFSVAYEAQVRGVIEILRSCGLRPLAARRRDADPAVVVGGAAVLGSPALFTPVADAVVVGDGETAIDAIARGVAAGIGKRRLIAALGGLPGVLTGPFSPCRPPPLATAPLERLPVCSAYVTPHAVFKNMFLVEVMRGCPHPCAFCIMRSGGGRRKTVFVPARKVLECIPPWAKRVGLVGPSVLDHPGIDEILEELTGRGVSLGLSSLSARKLTPERCRVLARAGVRTATIALDPPSERIRRQVRKPVGARDVVEAARRCREAGIAGVKLYALVGFEGEDEEDWRELAATCRAAGAEIPLSVSVAPIVPKRYTPLESAPFVTRQRYESAVSLLKGLIGGAACIKSESYRTARFEYELSRAGEEEVRLLAEGRT